MSESTNTRLPPRTAMSVDEQALVSWGQISAYLLDVEQRRLWESSAASFSQWVIAFAERRHRTVAMVWRYLSAGRFYRGRMAVHADRGTALPDLPLISKRVSPDSLELLEKISRVASRELLEDLERRVLRGEHCREELRAAWRSYRPLLEGRTARGKDVETPRVSERDLGQSASRAEADCKMGLHRQGPSWSGHANAKAYQVFALEGLFKVSSNRRISIDAVAVIRPSSKADIEIHGIQVKGRHSGFGQVDVVNLPTLVDYTWVIVPEEEDPPSLRGIPPGVGVLTATISTVKVFRAATRIEREPSPSEALTRELLLRSLRP